MEFDQYVRLTIQINEGEPRLVIPFFDENNKLIGARKGSGNPKYDMLL